MRRGLVGHADAAMDLDIGAAVVECGLVAEALGGGDMKGGVGIARVKADIYQVADQGAALLETARVEESLEAALAPFAAACGGTWAPWYTDAAPVVARACHAR